MIKEIIVVEGRDDITSVKQAVEAEVIAVHGFGLTKENIELIRKAVELRGVIVLTDPDPAGESIRRRIEKLCPGVRHAYIMREDGLRGGDVGVENASPETIRNALSKAHAGQIAGRQEFTVADLFDNGLMAGRGAKERRRVLGKRLGIGYASSSTLLTRLNQYGISRQDFEAALDGLDRS